jgi:hypothetical protein
MNTSRFATGMAAVLATVVVTGAVVAQTAAEVPPPTRFERVLWCSDLVRSAKQAAALGFTAVQLGRGVDPKPALEAGLGFYLDQPIGKGVLELRDEQWQPLARAYEQQRDASVLIRPGCYGDPERLAAAVAAAVAETQRVAGPALRFVALADEPSATRHDAPLDTCRCAHCLAAFRAHVQKVHPELAAACAVLGTQYAAFADVLPPTTDQIRRRELGERALPRDLRGWNLARQFVDEQFAAAVHQLAAAVQRAVPTVPVGLTGTSAPAAFGGSDPRRLLSPLTLVEPYAIGGAVELANAFAPSAHRYATIAPPGPDELAGAPLDDFVRSQVVALACRGAAGVVVWNDGTVFGDGGQPTPFAAALGASLQRYGPALDACAGASIEPSSVWMVEDQATVRAWWMLDSVGDGMTWVRRLASYEAKNSTSQAARVGWLRLLQDLGFTPRLVGSDGLAERLLQQAPRCLVLPALLSLDDRTAQAIVAYTRAGGVVLADHGTALYDGSLLRRERGGLDDLFGITERSLDWDDQLVRQGRVQGGGRGLPLAEARLRGELAERRDAGDAQVEKKHGTGLAVYLNAPVAAYDAWRLDEKAVEPARELRRRVRSVLQRAGLQPPCELRGDGLPTCVARTVLKLRDGRTVHAIQLQALARPGLLAQLAKDGPRAVTFELPAARTLRLLGGAEGVQPELGRTARCELRLDPFGALFVEVAD